MVGRKNNQTTNQQSCPLSKIVGLLFAMSFIFVFFEKYPKFLYPIFKNYIRYKAFLSDTKRMSALSFRTISHYEFSPINRCVNFPIDLIRKSHAKYQANAISNFWYLKYLNSNSFHSIQNKIF